MIYLSYTQATSTSTLRRALQNIDAMANRASLIARGADLAQALRSKAEAVRDPAGVG
mgnify:CR=1 FL=1